MPTLEDRMFGRIDRELTVEERADLEFYAEHHRKFVDQVMAEAGAKFAAAVAENFGAKDARHLSRD